MALSYAESLRRSHEAKQVQQQASTVSTYSASTPVVYATSDDYEWYDEYEDDNFSSIDEMKNITVNSRQINLTQEVNSQFIPFSMPRYYDGVDLMTKTLWIHYVTSKKTEDLVKAVNVSYTDDEIQFGWLVSSTATSFAGTLQFEVIAVGTNSKDEPYVWKSRVGTLNIIQSLEGDGVVETSTNLYELIEELSKEVAMTTEDIQTLKEAIEQITSISTEDVDKVFDELLGNY